MYVHVGKNVISIIGSDIRCTKEITSEAGLVTIATESHILAQTGGSVYFPIGNYSKHSLIRGRVGTGEIVIPYDGLISVNDQIYFCVTYIISSTPS